MQVYRIQDFREILGYPSKSNAVNLFMKCYPIYPVVQPGQKNANYFCPVVSVLQRVYSHTHTAPQPKPGPGGTLSQKQIQAHQLAWARMEKLEHLQATFDGYILDVVLTGPRRKGVYMYV